MNGDLQVIADLLIGYRCVPNAHDEVLPLVTGFGPQHPSNVHLGKDRKPFRFECQSRAQYRLVITFSDVDCVAVTAHHPYGNASMSLVAIPNVSEGRDAEKVALLSSACSAGGAQVLDVHSDHSHHRSVFTLWGDAPALVQGLTALAHAAVEVVDLRGHDGLHPRLGVLDVCPFVFTGDAGPAVRAARETAHAIGTGAGIPVLLYGDAADDPARRELPDLRRGGWERWAAEFAAGAHPDAGPDRIDPKRGLVCVGARPPLIAFNVWLEGDLSIARQIAARVRESSGGLPGVRAIALDMDGGSTQVSMNLTRPDETGIDEAFELVAQMARTAGVREIRGEIVGVPPERYMPDPEREAARQISPPGRSLESLLRGA